jgi:predicted nuclease with TOPRIM domain
VVQLLDADGTPTRQGKGTCNARPIRAETIELLVRDRIATLAGTKSGLDEVTKRIPLRIASERQELRRQKTCLSERIDTLSGKFDQLQSVASNADDSSRAHYEARITQLTTERDSLRARLRELELRLGALENLVLETSWIGEELQHFDVVWDHLLPVNRQRLVRSVVQRIDVDEPAGNVDIVLQAAKTFKVISGT